MTPFYFFKDLKMIFAVLWFSLAAYSIKLALFDAKFSLLVGAVFVVIYTIIGLFILNKMAAKRLEQLHHLLYENCRVSSYLARCEQLKNTTHSPAKCRVPLIFDFTQSVLVNRFYLHYWLAIGHLACNNLEKAKPAMEAAKEIISETGHQKSRLTQVLYPVQFLFALQSENYPEAEWILQEEECAFFHEIGKSIKVTDLHHALLSLEKGLPEQALSLLPALLSQTNQKLDKVMLSWYLAKALSLSNQTDEALPYLHFAVENGGDTFYAQKAQTLLTNKETCPLPD